MQSDFDPAETNFLVRGFRFGFDLCYHGPIVRRSTSRNLPFTVGNKYELWKKISKEV